ncbi:MAG TPA: sigma-70 family RNA polymerase sigma factor [Bryobacteraceae bacterium]|nr:sigma-70 family RNA polymerase sigma factor [Bryobacteraceae bacterium]
MGLVEVPPQGAGRAQEVEREVVAVYNQHAAELLQYATSLARDGETARDAVQEVFLRFFVERRYGRIIEQPRAWLFQTLRNHLFDHLKSAAVQRETSCDTLDSIPDQRHNPELQLGRSDLARRLAGVLTPREFDCLRLRAEGLAYGEIAGILGIRSGTVGALLARVWKKAREAGGIGVPAGAVCSSPGSAQ